MLLNNRQTAQVSTRGAIRLWRAQWLLAIAYACSDVIVDVLHYSRFLAVTSVMTAAEPVLGFLSQVA